MIAKSRMASDPNSLAMQQRCIAEVGERVADIYNHVYDKRLSLCLGRGGEERAGVLGLGFGARENSVPVFSDREEIRMTRQACRSAAEEYALRMQEYAYSKLFAKCMEQSIGGRRRSRSRRSRKPKRRATKSRRRS
jgi:hypothetical protein